MRIRTDAMNHTLLSYLQICFAMVTAKQLDTAYLITQRCQSLTVADPDHFDTDSGLAFHFDTDLDPFIYFFK
jgi:hypothetical protein